MFIIIAISLSFLSKTNPKYLMPVTYFIVISAVCMSFKLLETGLLTAWNSMECVYQSWL